MIRALRSLTVLALSAACTAFSFAQAPPPVHHSPVVNPDGSVTFSLLAPTATSLDVHTDAVLKPLPMTKGDDGFWTLTTQPLTPSWYGYSFSLNGKIDILDPINNHVRENYSGLSSEFLIPGTPPAPWENTDIPHGRVDQIHYTTHTAQNMPNNQSGYIIYLPPNYDAKKKGGYPVLYLLHGWSDNETGWTRVGRANFIMDTLIDSGKAVPMIVVMPLGYGDLTFVTDHGVWNKPDTVDHNTTLYEQTLLTEVMPAVERDYNIAKGRNNHAIAGLSMGGLESLTVGLHNPDKFAYVVGLSSAVHNADFDRHFPTFASPDAAKKADYKLFWVACGTDDGLIKPNREFIIWAKAKGLPVTPIETPGAHTWVVWRNNLTNFAPLLFR
jgi:enterochelin esterase family protein